MLPIRLFFCLTLGLLVSGSALSQDTTSFIMPKNSVGISTGTLLVYFNAMAQYERHLKTFSSKKLISHLYFHAGYGPYLSWGGDGQVYDISVKWILGRERAFLETGLGLAALYDGYGYRIHVSDRTYLTEGRQSPRGRTDFVDWIPAFKFAFRYQKPGRQNIFRVGIGSPEAFFVSMSRAF